MHAAIMEHKDTPFAWGSHDCLMMACKLIEAMTGVHPGKDFEGTYSTELGALKVAVSKGHDSIDALVEAIVKEHGFVEAPANHHHRGDLVKVTDQGGATYGIVHLSGRDAICIGESGLKTIPLAGNVQKIWRVPY